MRPFAGQRKKGFIGTHLFGHILIARPISAQNGASAESRINIAGRLVAPALTGRMAAKFIGNKLPDL